jgi:hypothetical protein
MTAHLLANHHTAGSSSPFVERLRARTAPLAPGFVVWAALLLQFAPAIALVIYLRG